jgi:hypothetical protein
MNLIEHTARNAYRLIGVGSLLLCTAMAHGKPGEHIKAGNALLKPSLDVGMEYRTNVLQKPSDAVGGPNIFLQPGFDVETKTADTHFTLTSLYTLRKYFQEDLTRADRYTDFDLGASVNVMRSSVIGFRLNDRATLRNDNNLVALHSNLHNGLATQMAIRPGPVLELRVGGLWDYDRYMVPSSGLGQSDGSSSLLSQRNTVGPTFEAEWRFFPRTAFILDSSYSYYFWTNESAGQSNTNTRQGRIRAGLRGRLTERLVISALLGYGGGKYTDTVKISGLTGLLAEAQVKYSFNKKHQLAVGYQKNFQDVYFSDFVSFNRVYSRYHGEFSPRFAADLVVYANFDEYKGAVTRSDLFLDTSLNLVFKANKWVSVTTGASWKHRDSTDRLVSYDDVGIQAFLSFDY